MRAEKKKAAEAFRQRRQRVNPARPGDKPVPKRNLGDRIKYLKPKRLKSLQHKLIDEGLSLGAVGIACALLVFLLAWCRRRYRRKRRGLPLHSGGGKGHKQRGLFGGPSEVLPNDVAQACRTNRSTVVEAWLRRCGSPDARVRCISYRACTSLYWGVVMGSGAPPERSAPYLRLNFFSETVAISLVLLAVALLIRHRLHGHY